LQQVIEEARPKVVFHLAGVLKANLPETYYTVNVLGAVALFEAIRAAGAKPRVVVTSSSAVYGASVWTGCYPRLNRKHL
jgi:nucleoside-diphosphate-sugar epimerase